MKTIKIKALEFGAGKPKVCVPMTGKTTTELLEQAANGKAAEADLIEWRIDHYDSVMDSEELMRTGKLIKEILGDMPLLLTFRTKEEGGAKDISLEAYEELLTGICKNQMADMIDIEAMKEPQIVKRLVGKAKEYGLITVGSNHDFYQTPSKEEIIKRLCRMQELDLDITKIAVMPKTERDVLTLLDATLTMKEKYADRPFITMSMGKKGFISRIAGECFGSCLTFGTVGAASAPGQVDAKVLNQVLNLLHDDD